MLSFTQGKNVFVWIIFCGDPAPFFVLFGNKDHDAVYRKGMKDLFWEKLSADFGACHGGKERLFFLCGKCLRGSYAESLVQGDFHVFGIFCEEILQIARIKEKDEGYRDSDGKS